MNVHHGDNPAGAVDPNPDVTLDPRSPAAWWLRDRYRYRVQYGPRGGMKTYSATEAIVYAMLKRRTRVLCIRCTQKSLETSLKPELERWMRWRAVRDRFAVTRERIVCPSTGSEARFHGADVTTVESLRSTAAGIDITLIDEAHELKAGVWEVLLPSLRPEKPGDHIELWLCLNPRWATDPVYRDFVEHRRGAAEGQLMMKEVGWRQNPYFPSKLEADRLHDKATMPRALYEHVWEGKLRPGEAREGWYQLLDRRWIEAALSREWWDRRPRAADRQHYGNVALGHDVGEPDTRNNAVAVVHGPVVHWAEKFGASGWSGIGEHVERVGVKWAVHHAFVDATGVGQGAIAQYQARRLPHVPVAFGAPPRGRGVLWTRGATNADYFERRNAQLGWVLRMRLENAYRVHVQGERLPPERCGWINPDVPERDLLVEELARPVFTLSPTGKVRIEKHGLDKGASPDLYDALALAWAEDSLRGLRAHVWATRAMVAAA